VRIWSHQDPAVPSPKQVAQQPRRLLVATVADADHGLHRQIGRVLSGLRHVQQRGCISEQNEHLLALTCGHQPLHFSKQDRADRLPPRVIAGSAVHQHEGRPLPVHASDDLGAVGGYGSVDSVPIGWTGGSFETPKVELFSLHGYLRHTGG
jgi:hypothetical protein